MEIYTHELRQYARDSRYALQQRKDRIEAARRNNPRRNYLTHWSILAALGMPLAATLYA